jgi:hypothetical protein
MSAVRAASFRETARKGRIHDPTIIIAIEQGTAERGAVAPQSGPVLIGAAL